jgi:hypothetical protein
VPARWRVIASLWRAGAGPVVPARAKRTPSPARDVREDPQRCVPTLPWRLWVDLWLTPGWAAAAPSVPSTEGPSPFPPQVFGSIAARPSGLARGYIRRADLAAFHNAPRELREHFRPRAISGAPRPNPMPQAWGPAANRINAPPANQRQQTQAPPTLLRSAAFMRIATSSLERQRAAAVGAMSLDPRLGALLRAVREGDVLRRSRAVGTDH